MAEGSAPSADQSADERDSGPDAAPDWSDRLLCGASRRPTPVNATTFKKRWHTASNPVLLECDDGESYVVKGKQAGRMLVNDQVMGVLGHEMGGPVPAPVLVHVPAELINIEPDMAHMTSGVSHGCRWIPDATEREALSYTDRAENKPRFAYLAVLYGLASASDHQFIYDNREPRRVHSVDHGHFFPGGPEWTVSSLATGPPADLDPVIAGACTWTGEQLQAVRNALAALDDQTIADAVARPPDEWNLSSDERAELSEYLANRRNVLLTRLDERIDCA